MNDDAIKVARALQTLRATLENMMVDARGMELRLPHEQVRSLSIRLTAGDANCIRRDMPVPREYEIEIAGVRIISQPA